MARQLSPVFRRKPPDNEIVFLWVALESDNENHESHSTAGRGETAVTEAHVLVPLSETVTVRQTVAHAVQCGLDASDGSSPGRSNEDVSIHLVVAVPYEGDVPAGRRGIEDARALVEKASAWVREDAGSHDVAVETEILGTDEYLFGPRDYVRTFVAYGEKRGVEFDRIVVDPEYEPGATAPMLQPLERELEAAGFDIEEAPVERPARHERLASSGSRGRLVALFGVSYGFYLILGDPLYWFDLLTGFAVGAIVALSLSHVTFTKSPTLRGSPIRIARFGLYVPYLLFEIIRANLAISLVILRPSMPIDPRLTRVDARVHSGLPLLALANSITLTPGTLTVRANDQRLIVHSLIPSAREDLFAGGLERAIRFVFYGRNAARIATPEERGDAEIIGGEEA